MSLRGRLLLNADQVPGGGALGSFLSSPSQGWDVKVCTREETPSPPLTPLCRARRAGAGGQTAASQQERCDFKSRGSRTMCSA